MSRLPAIKHRLASGLSIAAVLFAIFFLAPDIVAPFVLAGLAALMAFEFYAMIKSGGIPNFNCFGALFSVMLVLAPWLEPRGFASAGTWDALILFLLIIGIFLRQFPQKDNPAPLQTIGGTLFGVLYVGLLWNFMSKLMVYQRPVDFAGSIYWPGRWLLLYAVFAAKFTDIGAYLVGCAIGRHKLIPRISPGKSWEGVFGGMAIGTLAGFLLVWGMEHTSVPFSALGLTPLRAIPLGICLSICAIVGDLVESLFKRAANVKDSGGIVPGMGGTLDVLDSILFTAPGVYLFLRLAA